MKLARLKLENWRAVVSRVIDFADGITLIEGPNEIGKSTLVEALCILFTEMDSSNKKSVKAVQPVGEDVGSRVEAEVISGPYHFTFSKTYNRSRGTELRVITPSPEQLTGREAHERALQMMQETVDMGLWNALMVEQGKAIQGVYLADSAGLARALDEAAGSGFGEDDDAGLYSAVQAEYEKYFTPVTGKSRVNGDAQRLDSLQAELEAAQTALAATEKDSEDYRRCLAEIRRLDATLPGLENNEQNYRLQWQRLEELLHRHDTKKTQLEHARELLRSASDEMDRRQRTADDLANSRKALEEARAGLEPLAARIMQCRQAATDAEQQCQASRTQQEELQRVVNLAREDERYLQAAQAIDRENARLARVRDCAGRIAEQRGILSALQIDADGLEQLRAAERELLLAQARRDTDTPRVEITVHRDLDLELNEDVLGLKAGDKTVRQVAADLRIGVPGTATVRVTPSRSAAELEAGVTERQEALDSLLQRYRVADLADAVAAQARRLEAQEESRRWQEKLEELLDGETGEGIAQSLDRMRVQFDAYVAQRPEKTPLPGSFPQAEAAREQAERRLEQALPTLESLQAKRDRLRIQCNGAEADQKVALKEIQGLEANLQRIGEQLETARQRASDESIELQAADRVTGVATLETELAHVSRDLQPDSVEMLKTLLTNAEDTRRRAEAELRQQQQTEAVLSDRLQRARADGEFEKLQAARQHLEELQEHHRAVSDRAAAAQRLWTTLNRHRDATRQAYVRPLQAGIEQLGRIVYGADFSIELDDTWSLVTCTRGGRTLPFDSLSVGMKEQLGILTRLAAARIVARQGGVPLIIDDALGFSDPGRLETMGAAIAACGRDTQIIVLTCTPERFTHVGSAVVVRL